MSKTKKAAPKAAKTPDQVFNLMARGSDFTAAVRESLAHSSAKLKNTPGIMYGSLASNQKLCLPIKPFALAYALDSKHLQSGRVFSVIGQDGVGKTTLVYTLFGWWIPHNIPCAHVEVEGKPMAEDRIRRCLHTNREIADQMFNTISFMQSFEFVDAINQIENWLKVIRDKNSPAYVPESIPAAVAVDTASKLMPPKEAAGYHMYAEDPEDKKGAKQQSAAEKKNEKKKNTIQELGAGSNLETSKLTHQWCRRLATILTKYNALLIWVRHQNEKVDMQGTPHGGGGSFVPADVKDQYNRTAIGGKAMAQNAAWEVVVTREKLDSVVMRDERVKIGQYVKISVAKNSYGAQRSCTYELIMVPRTDTETYQEPAIDFSPTLSRILQFTGLLKITENKGRITCPELNLDGVESQELDTSLQANHEVFDDLSMRLGLSCSGPNFKTPPLNTFFTPKVEEAPDLPLPPNAIE